MQMHRRVVLPFVICLAVAASTREARAQWGAGQYPYGYGGYGWGGWGSTVQGDIANGLGYFNIGAGIYNRETAIATAIDTDTLIRWNQYVYLSQKQATREYLARRDAALAKDRNAYDALLKRIQDHPTTADIENGDALNAALDQLSDPRIHSSALRMADAPVNAKMIRDIPFRNAAEAVTFSLSQLKEASQWPAVLLDPRFAGERADFEVLVDAARKDSTDDGQVSHETLKQMRGFANRLKEKLMAMPLEDKAENQEALKFVKTVSALARMLEKPDIEQVLEELKKIEKTSIGNLLGFMHTFNLRFAPATSARQRQVYGELFPVLDQTRNRIVGEAKLDETANGKAGRGKLHDFFSAMDMENIEGKKPAPPTPPQPAQP
jgi:hypothetical protein